jgi:hypothetical protein
MQHDLIYACERVCTRENTPPFGEGILSTYISENRCGYSAVLSVMAGQMSMTSSNQDTQAYPL